MRAVIFETRNKEKAFPKLMINTDKTVIVLGKEFTHSDKDYRSFHGVILTTKTKLLAVGESWDSLSYDDFTDFEGTLTLQNEEA